jgi:hypothetical protein
MKRKIFVVLIVALWLCCSAVILSLPQEAFAAPFTDNGNGTVTDTKSGLVWQQGEPGYMTWPEALNYCEALELPLGSGQSDWRLPNIKELESITDDTVYDPVNHPIAIDTNAFPNANASYYWSSTTYAYDPSFAWGVYFNYGYVTNDYKNYDMYVRCVRGGQSGSLDTLTIATPVPTMNEWGMIIFMALAGLSSAYYLRRQRRA